VQKQKLDGITAHSQGGLGNQLFILAAGLNLALKHESKLFVDTSLNKLPGSRPFRLENFLKSDLVEIEQIESNWPRWKLSLQNLGVFNFCNILETNYPEVARGCLWGYFQSQKFHQEFQSEIYSAFYASLVKSVSTTWDPSLHRDAITVHVRRGDYERGAAAKHHGCLDYVYYQQVLQEYQGKVNVVSNDPTSVVRLQELLPDREIRLIEGKSEFDDLVFLANSKTLVIANSSFSWWGAALGVNDKLVIAPKLWYRNPPTIVHPIHLQNWVEAETRFEKL
jgi:hypothetical protein